MHRKPIPRKCRLGHPNGGFTLLEILVAFAVMSVAVTVLLRLYFASHDILRDNRSRMAATSLAQEHLDWALRNPEAFAWPDPATLKTGTLTPAPLKGQTAGEDMSAEPPAAMPVREREYQRELGFYGRFTWQVYATAGAADSKTVVVVSVVDWRSHGRMNVVALTSCLPKSEVGGAA